MKLLFKVLGAVLLGSLVLTGCPAKTKTPAKTPAKTEAKTKTKTEAEAKTEKS